MPPPWITVSALGGGAWEGYGERLYNANQAEHRPAARVLQLLQYSLCRRQTRFITAVDRESARSIAVPLIRSTQARFGFRVEKVDLVLLKADANGRAGRRRDLVMGLHDDAGPIGRIDVVIADPAQAFR